MNRTDTCISKLQIDHYAAIDSKVKTSLTKAYNAASHTSQVLVSELAAKVGKKGKGRGAGAGTGDLDEETAGLLGEDALDELALLAPEDEGDDDGEEDISALLAKKPSTAAKKAAASKAGAAAGATSGGAKGKAKAGKAGAK